MRIYERQKPLISAAAGMSGFVLVGWLPNPGNTENFCGRAIRRITQNYVTLIKPISGFDKESYYLCKIVEKSCCAVVLFGVKNVTISTNRSSILDGVIQYHYLSIFKSKPIAMAALLAPIFFAPSSLGLPAFSPGR